MGFILLMEKILHRKVSYMSGGAGFLPSTVFWMVFQKTYKKCLKNWMISPAFGVRFWSCHGLLPASL